MPAIQGMTRIDSILFTREYFAGLKARTLGQADLAFEHFSRCTELNPRSDAAWYELAILHSTRGARARALTMINRAIPSMICKPGTLADRKSTRLKSSHSCASRKPSSA